METIKLVKEPSSLYKVRFQDCDPMGHLNNARYIDYMLNAREDHLETYYDLRLTDFIKKGMGWVVAQHEVYYVKPALFNEEIEIVTAVVHFNETEIIVEGRILDSKERKLKCLIWTRYVFVSVANGKKMEHTEDLLQFFTSIKIEINCNSVADRLKLLKNAA